MTTAEKILSELDPLSQKKLGKKIMGYNEASWSKICDEIMLKGLRGKFEQNKRLAEYLVNTGARTIVEASPYDQYWGSGSRLDDSSTLDGSSFSGLNKMGAMLMEVRALLSDHEMS